MIIVSIIFPVSFETIENDPGTTLVIYRHVERAPLAKIIENALF